MSAVAAIRDLLAKGFTIEQALIAAEAFEQAPAPGKERSSAAVRQARYRENKIAKASQTVTGDVTDDVTQPITNVTPLRPDTPSPRVRAFFIGEELSNITPNLPSEDIPTTKARNARPDRGHRLPEGWRPNDGSRSLAVGLLGSGKASIAELEKFTDFWRAKAGADACKLDWDATWRNWVRRAAESRPNARASPSQGRFSPDPQINALAEAVEYYDQQS